MLMVTNLPKKEKSVSLEIYAMKLKYMQNKKGKNDRLNSVHKIMAISTLYHLEFIPYLHFLQFIWSGSFIVEEVSISRM